MKVKQIIEKLQKYDGNCECEMYVASGCESQKILKVNKSIVDKNKVIIFPKFVMTSHLTDKDIENVCKKCMKNPNRCSNVNQRQKCKWNFDEEGKPKKEIKV